MRGSEQLRDELRRRVTWTLVAGLVPGLVVLAVSPAGGPTAALLDAGLLGFALWLNRGSAFAAVAAGRSMTGNQLLLLLLALGGASVLVATGAGSRPLHGLAVAPFAMAAFAVSSQNARDLRSGVIAGAAALGVLSVADDRGLALAGCALGLLPLLFAWIAVRELMLLENGIELQVVTRASRPWGALVALRLALLAVIATLLLPSEPPPRGHGGSSSTAFPGDRGYAIAGSDGAMSLLTRGSLDDTPVLQVPADSPTLWQGAYLDAYTGTGWQRTLPPTASVAPRYGPLAAAASLPSGAGLQQSLVQRLSPYLPLVYAPGPLIAVGGSTGRWFDLGTGSIAVEDHTGALLSYVVDWRASQPTWTGILSSVQVPVSDPRWLALPAELPHRVRALATSVTAGLTTTEAKVHAVQSYLSSHEKYELSSPVPSPGQDAVDRFLFVDHLGFCEQFASAETVMLRALGIPARIATGFGGSGAAGTVGTRVYRNEDAHAWVQVGYAGEKWVDSDPTAGSQLAASTVHRSLWQRLKALWHQLTGTAQARRLLALALAVASLVVWWVVVLVRRRRVSRRADAPAPALTDVGIAYQRLLVRLAEQDRPRRPNETLRDLLLRLRAPDLDLVARVLETEWYGGGVPAPAERVQRAVVVLDGLAAEPLVASAP